RLPRLARKSGSHCTLDAAIDRQHGRLRPRALWSIGLLPPYCAHLSRREQRPRRGRSSQAAVTISRPGPDPGHRPRYGPSWEGGRWRWLGAIRGGSQKHQWPDIRSGPRFWDQRLDGKTAGSVVLDGADDEQAETED